MIINPSNNPPAPTIIYGKPNPFEIKANSLYVKSATTEFLNYDVTGGDMVGKCGITSNNILSISKIANTPPNMGYTSFYNGSDVGIYSVNQDGTVSSSEWMTQQGLVYDTCTNLDFTFSVRNISGNSWAIYRSKGRVNSTSAAVAIYDATTFKYMYNTAGQDKPVFIRVSPCGSILAVAHKTTAISLMLRVYSVANNGSLTLINVYNTSLYEGVMISCFIYEYNNVVYICLVDMESNITSSTDTGTYLNAYRINLVNGTRETSYISLSGLDWKANYVLFRAKLIHLNGSVYFMGANHDNWFNVNNFFVFRFFPSNANRFLIENPANNRIIGTIPKNSNTVIVFLITPEKYLIMREININGTSTAVAHHLSYGTEISNFTLNHNQYCERPLLLVNTETASYNGNVAFLFIVGYQVLVFKRRMITNVRDMINVVTYEC
jgi:hypothetical protein